MPRGRDSDDTSGDTPPQLSLRQGGRGKDKAPLLDRLRTAIVKPVEPDADHDWDEPSSIEELEADLKSANDKERLVGLLAAPLAALIGILVISALISNDPPAFLKGGQVNALHVSVSLYRDLAGVLVGLSVLMLVMAMLRKRLFLGIVMALFGLAVFNLHYWGFGVPFILGGAWLLVRAYRLQRDLREATGEVASRRGRPSGGTPSRATVAQRNKRYAPPAPSPKPSPPSRPAKRQRAG